MSILYFLYNEIFYRPLYNGLVFLINIMPGNNVGLAVIFLTIITRIIIFPLTKQAIKTQIKIQRIEPDIKKAREKFTDKHKQTQEILDIYRKNGVNPYSGFLSILIQFPVLIALYQVFGRGLSLDHNLYSFLTKPENPNFIFLGFLDISKKSSLLAVATGLSQFLQMHFSSPSKSHQAKNIQNSKGNSFEDTLKRSLSFQMKYIMPAFIFLIALKFQAAVSLYWTTMNLFAIVQENIIRKKYESRL